MSIKLGVPSKGRLMEKTLTGSGRAVSRCGSADPNGNMPGRSRESTGWNWCC